MRRSGLRHPIIALLVVVLGGIGLVGAYRYWESYYLHRGFATVAYLPHVRRGHLVDIDFYSRALGRKTDYLAYLPPGYGGGARYPVFYLLHGSPGRPKVFIDIAGMDVRMDNLISRHRMRPMILVMPDGRIHGSTLSDSEWANTAAGRYESYVLDVVADVDHRFATLANRHDRVVAGFSAGAYGATNVVLRNLATFAGLQSWSGYFRQTRGGVFSNASRAALVANSPANYVQGLSGELRADPLHAFLLVGRDDDNSPQTPPMAKALAAAGAGVSYALYPGGHDWQLWHAHLDQMLVLASQDTVAPLPRGPQQARLLTPGAVPIPNGAGRRHAPRTRARRLAPAGAATPRATRRRRHARHAHRRRPTQPVGAGQQLRV